MKNSFTNVKYIKQNGLSERFNFILSGRGKGVMTGKVLPFATGAIANMDGYFTIYHVDHLYSFFSAFNANSSKDGKQHNFNIESDVSLLSVNASAEVPVGGKLTSVMAFRRFCKGYVYNKIFDQYNIKNKVWSVQ